MNIPKKELEKLNKEGLITAQQVEQITNYYQTKNDNNKLWKRLLVISGFVRYYFNNRCKLGIDSQLYKSFCRLYFIFNINICGLPPYNKQQKEFIGSFFNYFFFYGCRKYRPYCTRDRKSTRLNSSHLSSTVFRKAFIHICTTFMLFLLINFYRFPKNTMFQYFRFYYISYCNFYILWQ